MPPKSALTSRRSAPKGSKPAPSLMAKVPDEELPKETLQSICRDEKAPAAARAQAARTLLELSGALKNTVSPDTKSASEVTLAELDERIAALDTETPDTHDGV